MWELAKQNGGSHLNFRIKLQNNLLIVYGNRENGCIFFIDMSTSNLQKPKREFGSYTKEAERLFN